VAVLLPNGEATREMTELKVGDKVTFAKLRDMGFSQCPVAKRDFSYWFSASQGYWVKIVDNTVVRRFTE
jgi:hypothetical protein